MTRTAIIAACVLAALNGGVFFAFSNFIMRALDRLGPQAGGDAMRSINVTVITPAFMTLLFGTGLVALLAATLAFGEDQEPWLVLVGALLYLLGCIAVTLFGNVPLNDALGATPPMAWQKFYPAWDRFNIFRTIACILSSITFAIAALRLS
ncbi:anthrone oxygenase family protein [Sphingopyxis sp.]|jgi:uncharacterized membrane protein|uniref:anthrone oxygenase family protein n=1 Tax=Sphingopyxis sp. TaxID=1908224 RepID=UPI003F6F4D9E